MTSIFVPPLPETVHKVFVVWSGGRRTLRELLALRESVPVLANEDRAKLIQDTEGTAAYYLGEYLLGTALDIQREGAKRNLTIQIR